METKKETNTMHAALAKAQSAVLAATKDAKNTFFNSKYATLAEVLAVVRDPLASNGFALLQDADTDLHEMNVGVVTRLLHESGGELASKRLSCSLRPEYAKDGKELKPSVQQVGSMVTYLRRYSLCSFLSVAIEDDDGNEVSRIGTGAQAPAPAPSTAGVEPAKSTRTSAHTGQRLDTPEAVSAHKAAAEKQAAVNTPEGQKKVIYGVDNRDLAEAMFRASVTKEGLEGYLRGTLGEPRISKPLLVGDLGINSLGGPIVAAMLRPDNWKLIVDRIHCDSEYVPF